MNEKIDCHMTNHTITFLLEQPAIVKKIGCLIAYLRTPLIECILMVH